ncbi:MAG: CHAT domain-containing protein, partial [Sideroxyarcus sp.]|nr:CHAT domain-containing protein [Sideroxyarcus sp.]
DVNKEPVLMRRTVRYVTSLVQLIEKVGEAPAVGPACIVANPAYPTSAQQGGNAQSGRISMRTLDSGNVVVPPLPDTSLEAHAVAAALTHMGWSVNRLEADKATADALLGLPQPPRVLHVASHAILFDSSVDPETAVKGNQNSSNNIIDLMLPGRRGALVLAGKERPSLLLALDFMKIPLLGTQLAVLSACDTGNGDVDVGEGVNSLRRSLEQAGVLSTVTSLWPVPSRGTATLMEGFYRQLAQGHPKSRALQLAKIEHRDRGAPMIEWASFLLAGMDSALITA